MIRNDGSLPWENANIHYFHNTSPLWIGMSEIWVTASGTYPVTAMVFKKFYLSNSVQQWGQIFHFPDLMQEDLQEASSWEWNSSASADPKNDPKNVPKMLPQAMVTGNSSSRKKVFSDQHWNPPWVYVTIGETNGSTVKKLAAILCSDPNINNVQHFQGTLLNKHVLRCVQESFPFLLPVHISIATLLGCVAQYGSTNWRSR